MGIVKEWLIDQTKLPDFEYFFSVIEELGCEPTRAFNINLVFEEIITNIVKYSRCSSEIKLTFSFENDLLTMTFLDDGVDFNPISDFTAQLGTENIGGLGLHLVKNVSKSFSYNRVNSHNVTKIEI